MKLVTKKVKAKTLAEVEKELQAIQKQLEVECSTCEGTGKPKRPKIKERKTPQSGHGDARCGTCYGTGILGNRIELMENKIEAIRKNTARLGSNLDAHINKQATEIRVLPDGKDPDVVSNWESYSGTFRISNKEERNLVLKKAKKHYEKYFCDAVYHRNKKLGIFLISQRSGKQLIEKVETD